MESFVCSECGETFSRDFKWMNEDKPLCLECFLEITITCPKCKGNPLYEEWLPAVEVGVQQPGEPIPCKLCEGEGYVMKYIGEQWLRDNAPPADYQRHRGLFREA